MRPFEAELVEPSAPLDAGLLAVVVAPETAEFVWLVLRFAEADWLVNELEKVDPPVLGAKEVDADIVDVEDAPRFDVGTVEFVEMAVPLDAVPLTVPGNVLAVLVEGLDGLVEVPAVLATGLDGLVNVFVEGLDGLVNVLAVVVEGLAVVVEGLAVPVNVLVVLAEVLEGLVIPVAETLEFARSAPKVPEAAWLVGASALVWGWVWVLDVVAVVELDEAGGLTLWAATVGRSVVVEESRPPLVAPARPTR